MTAPVEDGESEITTTTLDEFIKLDPIELEKGSGIFITPYYRLESKTYHFIGIDLVKTLNPETEIAPQLLHKFLTSKKGKECVIKGWVLDNQ